MATVDDHGDNKASATRITLGSTAGFTLGTTTDTDSFRVFLKSGQYMARIDGYKASGLSMGWLGDQLLVGDSGNTINVGTDAHLSYLYVIQDDWYTISLSSWQHITADYTFSLTSTLAKDQYSAANGGSSFFPGTPVVGSLEKAGEQDRVSPIFMDLGHEYTVRLELAGTEQFTLGKGSSSILLQLTDQYGKVLASATGGEKLGSATLTYKAADPSGVYYLTVADTQGTSTGTYRIISSDSTKNSGDDFSSDLINATPFGSGPTLTGTLEQLGDVDAVKVRMEAGKTYQLSSTWTGTTYKGTFASELYDKLGRKVTTPAGQGNPFESSTYTAAVTGDYTIRSAGANDTGTYSLTFQEIPRIDDVPDNPALSPSLALNKAILGNWETQGDTDSYRVLFEAGTTYTISLSNNGGATAGANYLGRIFGTGVHGTTLYTYVDGGYLYTTIGPVSNQFTPVETGYFYLILNGYDVASYALQVSANDTTAPAVPSVSAQLSGNMLHGQAPLFSGEADPGSTVTVEANGIALGNALANEHGYWELKSTGSFTGAVSIKVRAKDAAGNTSAASAAVILQAAPVKPSEPTLAGTPKDGMTTSTGKMVLSGTADPGNLVTVWDGSIKVAEVTADSTGKWSTVALAFADGNHSLKVTASNTAGLSASMSTNFVVDTTAPAVPQIAVTGMGNNYLASKTVHLTGTTEPGATVKIISNLSYIGIVEADAVGKWTWTSTTLDEGAQDWLIFARDRAGNDSAVTSLKFNVDTVAPGAPSIAQVQIDAGVNSNRPLLSGTAEPLSTISILVKGIEVGSTSANASGNWAVQLNALANGVHEAQAKASDVAGNFSGPSASKVLVIDSTQNIRGTQADDVIKVGAGSHFIDAGAGWDTAIFSGKLSAYSFGETSGTVRIENQLDSHTLNNVERVVFDDQTYAMDVAQGDKAGSVYRLYQAAFGRTPDSAGVGFWISQLDKGLALGEIADAFLKSTEFAVALSGFGSHDGGFARTLYANVLHRDPDLAGYDYWIKALGSGASRADMLISFSECPENIAQVASVVGNGFFFATFGG
jgi:hypothetical protein